MFSKRSTVEQVEEGRDLAPKFDADGLIACVTTSASTGEVLMLGYMNAEALPLGQKGDTRLEFREDRKLFDPKQVYGDAPNPTIL